MVLGLLLGKILLNFASIFTNFISQLGKNAHDLCWNVCRHVGIWLKISTIELECLPLFNDDEI